MRTTNQKSGVSWLASPGRRIVQGVFLLIFLILFFYVCWPYSARPETPGGISTGWTFIEIVQESGEFRFERHLPPERPLGTGQTLYLVNESELQAVRPQAAAFVVASVQELQILLHARELTPETLDVFLTSNGAWAMHEVEPGQWPSHYADDLARKALIPAETFLIIDPLVSLSTAIASRSWVWSLPAAVIILIICVLIPRGFCAYACPLGTMIDLFDWGVTGRVKRLRISDNGWWVHIKYYLLGATLICAVLGVLLSGFCAAIPLATRGMLFLLDPLQNGTMRAWHLVPPPSAGHYVSIGLFALVFCLGFLRPRFWCKYVCPSGALFSINTLLRVTERKVESSCINCNRCVETCPFDAIKPDFTTRVTDCTLCQSCAGVCPTRAIKFVARWSRVDLKTENSPPTNETVIGRRGFMSLAAGSATAVTSGVAVPALTKAFGAKLDHASAFRPVRPPGSVPEQTFLRMCIRCGECFKVCPNNVLQPESFQQGLEGLWTPMVVANWAGCEASCNACGQVCPTGAIRALPLEEKKVARMGLAVVNKSTCLPFAGRAACQLCVDECTAAGYCAIEFTQVGTEVDESGAPIEGSGHLAPVVLADKCVGCGLCQTRCHVINVKEKQLLSESSIRIEAGHGKEDRLMAGSYIELRQREAESQAEQAHRRQGTSGTEYFVPSFEDIPTESE
jgi:ferredoxin